MVKAEEFEAGHHDRVSVLHANFNGTRILTASIDHRIKVWDRNPKTGERTLIDTFTAHDADIRDAKFLHPTLGSHIASIGSDLKFHLWTEDASQAPNSGRRFRRITTIPSTPRVPFVSMDFKTIDNVYTTLALIDRQGLLSIYEPTNPDDYREWTLLDMFNVCGANPPGRGEETSFKVRFDQNPTPLAYVNSLSDERNQLSLIVSVLNDVKVYRSVLTNGGDGGMGAISSNGASHRIMFYEALKLPAHPALVRDVVWAPFSVRGTDRIATACKDGAVRIFELGVAEAPNGTNGAAPPGTTRSISTSGQSQRHQQQQQQQQQQQSSLTSAITGRANQAAAQSQHQGQNQQPPASSSASNNIPPPSSGTPSRTARTGHAFPFLTTLQSASTLPHAHTDAWSLAFDAQGQVLMSNGSDGATRLWRRSVLGGQWLAFAGQMVLLDGEDPEDDDDDEGDGEGGGGEGDDGADSD